MNAPNLQLQAAALAPALRQMQFGDADRLTASGDLQRLCTGQPASSGEGADGGIDWRRGGPIWLGQRY